MKSIKENKMKIGKFIKQALKELGYEFSATDTVSFVNWKLSQAHSFYYVSDGEYGLAVYSKY